MRSFLLVSLLAVTAAFSQPSNHVVISEVAPMGAGSSDFNSGEYVELYNPTPVDVTFGPNVQLISGNTSGTNNAEWQLSLSGKTIKAYGFLLIGDGGVTGPDAAFPANKNLANSGARSCVHLRDGAIVIDAFGWDQTTAPTLSAEGQSFKPSSTSGAKSFERKSGALSTAPDTLGNAWDSNNNSADFFENALAKMNPQSTTSPVEVNPYATGPANPGAAFLSPPVWKYNVATALQFVFTSPADTIRGIEIVKPGVFQWNAASASVTPAGTATAAGDTVRITGIVLAGTDSLVIIIPGVTASDSTDEVPVTVRSSTDAVSYSAIGSHPKTLVYGTPRPIGQIKKKEPNGVHSLLGRWAVTKGVVTVANEFGGPSYLQDGTAGMAVFDSSVSNHIEHGDEIVLLGKVAPFSDLFELAPATMLEKVSEGNPVDTLTMTVAQVLAQGAAEPDEGKLIRIKNITAVKTLADLPATSWSTTGSGTNYRITDPTGTMEIRVSSRINLANTPTPTGAFDVVGALGQFLTNYQILPRSADDIIPEGNGPRFTSVAPYERDMTPTSLTFVWTTDVPGTSKVRYGTTAAYGGEQEDTAKVTDHSMTVTGLQPATVYNIQLVSENALGTTVSANYVVSTSSLTSTGVINVYFNKSVNTALARGENAQVVNLAQKLIQKINAAAYSIDAALYSLSGTVGADVASALIAAKGRGVKVRVIGEKDNQSTAPWTTLKNAGIPVADDGLDAANGGAGLMHNKFVVFDNRDTTSDTDDWVWTGSWNLTDPGTNNDAQNAIELQDKALANAYTMEFQEMWGSAGETANAAASRFGARKYDNTPHLFNVGGTAVEAFFSPSDRTNAQLIRTLSKAASSINFALLTFTRSDIGNVLYAKKQAGVKVRGVFDNGTDQGSQFDTLKARGLDIFIAKNLTGLLHHKYAVVDADRNDSLQYVITGSHNWSSSAENSNNENTLILRSRRLANLYLQEFSVRYTDAGGTDVLLGVDRTGVHVPGRFALEQNYPNPFNPATTIRFSVGSASNVRLTVYDMLGRQTAVLHDGALREGSYSVQWNASALSSGVYFYRLEAGPFTQTKKLLLQK